MKATLQVALDNPKVLVEWDEGARCVIMTWKGEFTSGPELRSFWNRALDVLVEKRACRVLGDTRRMPVMTPEDQEWLQKEWMPRSVKLGLKYSAGVIPKSSLAKMAIRHLVEDNSAVPRQRGFFETVEEARAWLSSLPDPH